MNYLCKMVKYFLQHTEYIMCSDGKVKKSDFELYYRNLDFFAVLINENPTEESCLLRKEIAERLDELIERLVDFNYHNNNFFNIYTPAVQGYRKWYNVELGKDKGLLGYTLSKELGGKAYMFYCSDPKDYPALSQFPDYELIYSNEKVGDKKCYNKFLLENYEKMDVLILHGMYHETKLFLNEYRKLRPDGKVYCGLDLNKFWMEKINWNHPETIKFTQQCDIVATSCSSLRDQLNENPQVNFTCRYFPNGFYKKLYGTILLDQTKKEKILLTVGRIGTKQKNNEEMLFAFAKASDLLFDWKLKLVGNINKEFNQFIEHYFSLYPELKERVIFCGNIENKEDLYQEYEQASIFVMSSTFEGAPNVYAEALFHGCAFITSDIDAANDMTNKEELGIIYQSGNVDELSQAMIKLCSKINIDFWDDHFQKTTQYANKYFDWTRNAKKMAHMLFNDEITRTINKKNIDDVVKLKQENKQLTDDLAKSRQYTDLKDIAKQTIFDMGIPQSFELMEKQIKLNKNNLTTIKKENDLLIKENLKLKLENNNYKQKSNQLKGQLKWARKEIEKLRCSKSYKIGKMITWLPRKLTGIFK